MPQAKKLIGRTSTHPTKENLKALLLSGRDLELRQAMCELLQQLTCPSAPWESEAEEIELPVRVWGAVERVRELLGPDAPAVRS